MRIMDHEWLSVRQRHCIVDGLDSTSGEGISAAGSDPPFDRHLSVPLSAGMRVCRDKGLQG